MPPRPGTSSMVSWVCLQDSSCDLGVAKTEKRVVSLLDIGKVLSSDEVEELARTRFHDACQKVARENTYSAV